VNEKRIKVVACKTVIEEMRPLLPSGVTHEVLDFGLHITPEKLREALQQTVDRISHDVDVIILGYGLCSMGVVGLRAENCTLVVPRVDDCIAIFLGSTSAYREQGKKEPGTYYLTKGWIEVGDSPFEEYKRLIERYGRERADKVMNMMLKNYKRLVYIDTGWDDQERHRDHARRAAEKFNLRFEEITGSNRLIKRLIQGPWEEDFIVKGPGETIRFTDFK
jgi:hypothetical protein